MIALKKTDKPQILADHAIEWTNDLLAKLAADVEPSKSLRSRYNHPEIKASLIAETHGKCAYCESKFAHVTYGDVEHIQPKSKKPNLSFEWSNLTIACDVCNTNKSDSENVIDPYTDDPANHLNFEGTSIAAFPGSDAGNNTIDILKLNRPDLLGQRKKRRDYLYSLADNIAKTKDAKRRSALLEILMDEKKDQSEYAALSRALITSYISYFEALGMI